MMMVVVVRRKVVVGSKGDVGQSSGDTNSRVRTLKGRGGGDDTLIRRRWRIFVGVVVLFCFFCCYFRFMFVSG